MLTQARLKELLHYCPDTGVFTWRVSPSKKIRIGQKAGCVTAGKRTSYCVIRLDKALYKAHRLAWLYSYGGWPNGMIDHNDGDGLNNKLSNLSDTDSSGNNLNLPRRLDNSSGYIGVGLHAASGKYRARVCRNGARISLGLFNTSEEAADAVAIEYTKQGFNPNHGR